MTPRQRRFCEEFAKDLNATQAAIRAGFSARTAKQQGARLLSNVDVQQLIEAAQRERAERVGLDVDRLMLELARIATADVRKLFDGQQLRPPAELPDEIAAAVAGVEVLTKPAGNGKIERVYRIKLADKRAALVELLERLEPRRRTRPVRLELPEIRTPDDLLSAMRQVVAAMASGSLSPDEAAAVAGVLDAHRRAFETDDLERRLAALEAE